MPKLPSLSARQVIQALKRAGFVEDRQKGSHCIFIHPGTKARTVVPVHSGRSLKGPLLRAILRDANLTADQFLELL